MIPEHSHSGVLPPFLPGATPQSIKAVSPYKTSLLDVVRKFSQNASRLQLINGLISYRQKLRACGINSGFQWIGGSFIENCEDVRGRAPKDIDVVTFFSLPSNLSPKYIFESVPDLFDPETNKKNYLCDAYVVDLGCSPSYVVRQTTYWFGLLSHERDHFMWKGMLEIPLDGDDSVVHNYIAREDVK
jgi:hypothetical protein